MNFDGPPWEYSGMTFYSQEGLYAAIYARKLAEKGLNDAISLVAPGLGNPLDLAGHYGLAGSQPTMKKRFTMKGSSPGTSPISSFLRPRLGTSPYKLPTLTTVGLRYTTSVGGFVARKVPFLSFGLLAFEIRQLHVHF